MPACRDRRRRSRRSSAVSARTSPLPPRWRMLPGPSHCGSCHEYDELVRRAICPYGQQSPCRGSRCPRNLQTSNSSFPGCLRRRGSAVPRSQKSSRPGIGRARFLARAMLECPGAMDRHRQGMATHHHPRSPSTSRIVPARLGALVLAILYCSAWSPARGEEQRRKIYFLESLAPTQPAAIRTIEAFRRRLGEKTTESFDIFIDYMELERFPGQAHIDATVRYLQGKYAAAPPAVLIPLGRAAVPFMLRYRKVIAADAPVIMTSVPARATSEASGLDNAVWVVTDYDFAKALEFARRLQPKARQIVVIGGSSEYDRMWLDDARRELEPYRGAYAISYLADIGYGELLKQVSRLSPETIVIVSFVFRDGDGLPRVPPDVAAAVADASGAPVYSPISTYLNRGIVGGYMDSYEAHGVAAADLALEILSGRSIAALDRRSEERRVGKEGRCGEAPEDGERAVGG